VTTKPSDVKVDVARSLVRVSHLGDRASAIDTSRNKSSASRLLLSDKAQLDGAEAWCSRNGVRFDREESEGAVDLDVSGSKVPWRKRKGLMMHYAAAVRGEFDVLLCADVSRMGRSIADTRECVDAFLAAGVRIYSVGEGFEVCDDLPTNIMIAVAHHQAKETGKRIKGAALRRAQEGRPHGGGLPCWLRANRSSGKTVIEQVPEQVEAIRLIVHLRVSEGLGQTKIARALNLQGHRTIHGKRWTPGTIHKYLQDDWIDTMLGIGYFGRSKGEDERIQLPDVFPAIIEPEEAAALRAVQAAVSASSNALRGTKNWASNRKGKPRYSSSSPFLLGGLFRCSHCGASMIGNRKAGGVRVYTCPQYMSSPDLHVKGLSSVNAQHVEDAVLRVVRHMLQMPPAPGPLPKPKNVKRQVDRLKAMLDRLEEGFLEGVIALVRYREKKVDLEQQLVAAQEVEAQEALPFALRTALSFPADPTHDQLNELVHLLVERVEGPFHLPGYTIRSDMASLRRMVRVRLRYPANDGHQLYIAPLYYAKWGGERVIHPGLDQGI
jgi:DNA invertase Pin-like site-specific DNA recombinase